MNKKGKVLIALSGGVDSSVVATLLVKQGYSVTGVYMKQWSDTDDISGVCPWKEDRREAMRVAVFLGIPFLTFDFEKEYKKWVVDYLFREYKKGNTPNPDVLCNKFIKFGFWLEKAKKLGYDFLATGHYARKIEENNKFFLGVPKDDDKDQTYFLHQLNQEQLKHTLFPLGDLTKKEVRQQAKSFKLPNADRAESMGICFVGEVSIRDFLSQKIKPKKGKIILVDGTVIGWHHGLHLYTIGQRHLGIDIKARSPESAPLYVAGKDKKKNLLIVAERKDSILFREKIEAKDVSWVGGQELKFPLKCEVRLRHRQKPVKCIINSGKKGLVEVNFAEKQWGVSPGQFAVFYLNKNNKKVCLGGGVIV
jgi:tRNA-specific 2-thiouridylase